MNPNNNNSQGGAQGSQPVAQPVPPAPQPVAVVQPQPMAQAVPRSAAPVQPTQPVYVEQPPQESKMEKVVKSGGLIVSLLAIVTSIFGTASRVTKFKKK